MLQDAEEAPISQEDKTTIRNQLVPAMITLSLPADKALRAQIAESVSVVAEHDFPQKWPELIDVRFAFQSYSCAHRPHLATGFVALYDRLCRIFGRP